MDLTKARVERQPYGKVGDKFRYRWNEEADEVLRKHYVPGIRTRSTEIAVALGVPRYLVNRRARTLGLSHVKERAWTVREEQLLEELLPTVRLQEIARQLNRSRTAIVVKKTRMGLRKYDGGYTLSQLAKALGIDPAWVSRHVRGGRLRVYRRNTDRTPQQGGDAYMVLEKDLIGFIKEHPYTIDLRKVNRTWFMELIAPYLRTDGKETP